LTWQDTCSSHADNCPTGDQTATTGSQTTLQKLPSSTSTTIHNAAHQAVTTVEAGTTVHDFVSVTGGAGNPTPTGTVNVKWFTNNSCTGSAQSSSGNVSLAGNGTADLTSFTKSPGAGQFAFKAHYNGNGTYTASDGECEPLQVVDASIKILPDATNEVGAPHTFTVTVLKNDGTGNTPAAGVHVDYTLTDSNGAAHVTRPNPPTTCDGTTNANGTCKIVFQSPTAGKVVGNASVTLNLGGISVTRSTSSNSGSNGTGPATKTYVDASISISPEQASNEVGKPHTFTVTVKQNAGDGAGFVNVPNGTKPTVTLTNTNGANALVSSNSCNTTGTVAGQCTVTFKSNSAGLVTGNAAVTLVIGGVTLKRDTDPATSGIPSGPGGSGPAKKFYVDANITIGPNGNNPIGVHHTFTVTVKQDNGTGDGLVPVADGTKPTVTLTDSNGATTQVINDTCSPPNGAGTVSGSCTVEFTSSTPGTTTGNASVTLTVRGQTLVRATNGNSGPGGSGPAVKTWFNAQCVLGYPDGSNPPRSEVEFNESEVLRAFALYGTGDNKYVSAFYNDEHALTLGVRQVNTKTSGGTTTQNYPVTPMVGNPSHAVNPQTGATINQGGVDFAAGDGRPIAPSLFVTDITNSPSSRAGDWQQGSNASHSPDELFGTWKAAVRTEDQTKNPPTSTITPDPDPAKNNWNLGPGSDTPPGGFASLTNQGYGAEAKWTAQGLGLQPGHIYRLLLMVHDGDQNKTGGDVGEACVNMFIPND